MFISNHDLDAPEFVESTKRKLLYKINDEYKDTEEMTKK